MAEERGGELLVILADSDPEKTPEMLTNYLDTTRVNYTLVSARDATAEAMNRAAGALLFGMSAWPAQWPEGVAWNRADYIRIVEHAVATGLKMRIWGPAFEAVMYLFGGQVRRVANGGERRGAIELSFDDGDHDVLVATRHVVTTAAIGFESRLTSPGTFHPPIVEVATVAGGVGVVGVSFRPEMSARGRQLIATFVDICGASGRPTHSVSHYPARPTSPVSYYPARPASPTSVPPGPAFRGSAFRGAAFRGAPSRRPALPLTWTNRQSTTSNFTTIEEWKAHFAKQEEEAQELQRKRAELLGTYPPRRSDGGDSPEVIEVPADTPIVATNDAVGDAARVGERHRESWWDFDDVPVPVPADVGPDDDAADWADEREAIAAAMRDDDANDNNEVVFRDDPSSDVAIDPAEMERRWRAFCDRRYPTMTDAERELLGVAAEPA